MKSSDLMPRVIRASDAPAYLGIDKNKFNKLVRPNVIAVRLGTHSIGYDRLDLDAWWEQYKTCHGRLGADQVNERIQLWPKERLPVSNSAKVFGTLIKSSMDKEFVKALELVTGKKQKQSSRN